MPHYEYHLDGFDPTMLGSKVPAPGVHPRILFSPEDIPEMYALFQNSAEGKRLLWTTTMIVEKTIYDLDSNDGKVYQKLKSGDIENLKWPDKEYTTQKQLGKYKHLFEGHQKTNWRWSPHFAYYPFIMNGALLLAHFDQDEKRGEELAAAVTNYWILREEIIDDYLDNAARLGHVPADSWKGISSVIGGDTIAYNYDLAATWMDESQKSVMRRILSKIVKDRRPYMTNAPLSWHKHNWGPWMASEMIGCILAIEGEEGYDGSFVKEYVKKLEGHFMYGPNKNGSLYESNGKTGLKFLTTLMVSLARRDIGPNFFGHPHYRKLTQTQAQWVMPQTMTDIPFVASSGTHSNDYLNDPAFVKSFYPKDIYADWLMRQIRPSQNEFDLDAYKKQKTRSLLKLDFRDHFINPARSYYRILDWTGFKDKKGALLPASDSTPMNLPLEFIDHERGYFMARSDHSPEAVYLHFEARDDLTFSGHNYFNAGFFQMTAMGKIWSMIGDIKAFDGLLNSVPRIDGRAYQALPGNTRPPHADYMETTNDSLAVIGSANLKNVWDYAWGMMPNTVANYSAIKDRKLSLETSPKVVQFYKGTQHYKGRHRSIDGNYYKTPWSPPIRVESNPVQFAYRSAGLVKGKNPYVVVVDDLKKDEQYRRYEWVMQVPKSVRMLTLQGSSEIILVHDTEKTLKSFQINRTGSKSSDEKLIPQGTPLLLVKYLGKDLPKHFPDPDALDLEASVSQEAYRTTRGVFTTKVLKMGTRSQEMRSKILLIPFRHGESIPKINYNERRGVVIVNFDGKQKDKLTFTLDNNQTKINVERLK